MLLQIAMEVAQTAVTKTGRGQVKDTLRKDFAVAAQNLWDKDPGAWTGAGKQGEPSWEELMSRPGAVR